MNRRITVTVEANASVDGVAYKAGAQVETTLATALQLVEMGVIAALPEIDPPAVPGGEDPALHEKAKAMAETMTAQAVAQAMTETTAELENERRRADELALQLADVTAERDALKAAAGASAPAAPQAATLPGGEVTSPPPKKPGK